MAEENTTFTQNLLSNDSKVSSMRITLKTGIIPDFPPNFVWFVGTVVTVVTGGKVAQFAFGERGKENPTPAPPTTPPK